MSNTLLLVLFVACVGASCFFSGSETALTTLSDAAVFRLKEKKHPEAARLERLRGHLSQTLSTLLIGNTLVNIAAGSIGTVLAIEALGERWGVVAATVGTTLILLVFGEVTPKTLASRQAERFASAMAPAIDLLVTLLAPMAKLLSAIAGVLLRPFGGRTSSPADVTEEDVKSLISLSHEHGQLELEEKDILHAVLAFGDSPVVDAMVPRAKMVLLPADATFEKVEAIGRVWRYSRLPVYRDTPDDIVGILHVKDLFDVTDAEEKSFDLSRHLRPAIFIPEQKRSGDLFREMRRRRFHMAVVVDELGAVSGLVTLEDLVEQILGDIDDEHDEEADSPVIDGASILIEGSYPVASLERDLGLSLEEPEMETVAGFLLKKFGRIPRTGARTWLGDTEFAVERASPRAIERIRITKKARAPEEPAAEKG
ncbi:MAG TPA: hemolysin family protein [Thermoanaerobaculia bacterium]|nr:hemolysin family protein [Thermoanaerobaculia bacterium]